MKEKETKRKSIFGPSKDEIWTKIAADIDGEFIQGGFFRKNLTFTPTSCIVSLKPSVK